jgi:hypothetical protein
MYPAWHGFSNGTHQFEKKKAFGKINTFPTLGVYFGERGEAFGKKV